MSSSELVLLALFFIILSALGIESILNQDWMQWLFGILAVITVGMAFFTYLSEKKNKKTL